MGTLVSYVRVQQAWPDNAATSLALSASPAAVLEVDNAAGNRIAL